LHFHNQSFANLHFHDAGSGNLLIVDAHEDIAWNVLSFGRDYTHSALCLREQEAGTPIPYRVGSTLLGKSDWLLGHVGLIFATLFVSPAKFRRGAWDTQVYTTPQEAYRLASAQLDYYHRLVDEHAQFRLVGTRSDLEEVVSSWSDDCSLADRLIGLIPLMEGGDPILEPEQAEEWYERGVRIVGPAWEATRYAGGTHEAGGLTSAGWRLLDILASLEMILDLSHLAEESYYQAIEHYPGAVIASHSNPRRFLPTSRGLSDKMITLLAERGGITGIMPYNTFLKPGWRKGDPKGDVSLRQVVEAIDHVCQISGSVFSAGIGSDFDGGFGAEHVPAEIDSIADLARIGKLLAQIGYTSEQIACVMGNNWLRILRTALPD
jgi:membrane dipeptidase